MKSQSQSGSLMIHQLGRQDGPTLVLLHGFTDSGLCWPDAVRRWGHAYRIVAPDARGHGESPRFDPATSGSNRSQDMVADVVCLLEQLSLAGGSPPILVGHSMGAGIAGIVLAARPDLVCGAVLEDPPWITRPPGEVPTMEDDDTQLWVQGFRDDPEGSIDRAGAENPLMPGIELRPWAVSKAQLDPSLTAAEQIVRQSPWAQDVAAIARPALVVTGSRDDAVLVGPLSRQRLVDLANNQIEVEVVPGAGHTVRRDCPDAYHQIVDPWISKRLGT